MRLSSARVQRGVTDLELIYDLTYKHEQVLMGLP